MSVEATLFVWKLTKESITPLEKLILLSIADRCGEHGECWPSITRMMKDTLLSKDTIIRHRNKLITKGILRYTGEYKGYSKQIPIMQLMINSLREDDTTSDEINNDQTTTSSQQLPVPVATSYLHQSLPATQNLKEEPKRKEPKIICALSRTTLSSFDAFWKKYPSKVDKKKCIDIWKRKKLDSKFEEIMIGLENQNSNEPKWKAGFIPNPSTYLTGERWNDEITAPQVNMKKVEEQERKIENEKRIEQQERLSREESDRRLGLHKQYNHDGEVARAITAAAKRGDTTPPPLLRSFIKGV